MLLLLKERRVNNDVSLQLRPLSGPLEGGTVLTVDGENLGLSANDTIVSVAGLNCDTVEYLSPVRYVQIYLSTAFLQ